MVPIVVALVLSARFTLFLAPAKRVQMVLCLIIPSALLAVLGEVKQTGFHSCKVTTKCMGYFTLEGPSPAR